MDLISREDALEAIERLILPQGKGETAAEEINRVAWRCAINCAEEMIGHLPTIDPVKRGRWMNSEMDEAFRIADEVRMAVECKTAKECWELARNGEIQRVKHGRWIETKEWGGRNFSCSECRFEFAVDTCMLKPTWNYCPNCGARMDVPDNDVGETEGEEG